MLGSTASVAPATEPLRCDECNGFGRVGRFDCTRCHGTGKVECDSCRQHPNDAPAVTTALTDRHIKLCADCVSVDERDTRAFLASTGLPADAIARFFAVAPELTDAQLHALIPLPTEAYVAEIKRLTKCDGCQFNAATRRDAYDVADVCDFCGEASDTERARAVRHEKRLAALELI